MIDLSSLSNDKKRRAFLQDYRSWGVWFTVPELDLVFYKCGIANHRIIAMEYQQKNYIPLPGEPDYKTGLHYYLQQSGDKFMPNMRSESNLAEWLKGLKLRMEKGEKPNA